MEPTSRCLEMSFFSFVSPNTRDANFEQLKLSVFHCYGNHYMLVLLFFFALFRFVGFIFTVLSFKLF